MFSSILLLVPFFVTSALAQNDWATPCVSGSCQYDLPAVKGAESGTLKIWGAPSVISDITPAAGWKIIGCSPDALEQDIRLVCASSNGHCGHLFTHNRRGAVGKIVRLPDNCGKSAFAVVKKAFRARDQSIPQHLARDVANTTVQGLTITTSFDSVPVPDGGNVSFALRGANFQGAGGSLDTTPLERRDGLNSRGWFDWVDDVIDAIKQLDEFSVDKSTTLPLFNVNQNFNIFNAQASCPPLTASLSVDVGAIAQATAALGVAAHGTIIPPVVNDFAVIAGLNADLGGTLHVLATASGSFDTGRKQLLQVGIPGLDFPGILTIGPSFIVEAQATGSLNANVEVTVGIDYQIQNAQLVFPTNSQNGGGFSIGQTPLTISANPTAGVTGTVNGHLIPSLNIGISALGDIVSAGVFLNVDASATASLNIHAAANAGVTVPREIEARSPKSSEFAIRGQNLPGRDFFAPEPEMVVRSIQERTATGSFGGCFEIDANLNVNAGATADFFGLFNPSKTISLYNGSWDLYQKCFGSDASRRALLESRDELYELLEARSIMSLAPEKRAFSLSCTGSTDSSGLQNLINQIVTAIKKL
ncbi:hypothetical protein BDN70DRAFT_997286 [Pholiota conissans]|uniref:DUF7223 domain-containing protein n=1 Tax=Pholiota conissans TaxID=109636 RepID=A0A9P6CVE7_9AGAR|nr:hypothetical protein BDN70DRAFT_997286 [Pholiota conissans]